jgi:hypothetical protein
VFLQCHERSVHVFVIGRLFILTISLRLWTPHRQTWSEMLPMRASMPRISSWQTPFRSGGYYLFRGYFPSNIGAGKQRDKRNIQKVTLASFAHRDRHSAVCVHPGTFRQPSHYCYNASLMLGMQHFK